MFRREQMEVLRGKTDPIYGKDLNPKLRNWNIIQQRGSESFTATKHQDQLCARKKYPHQFNNPD